MSNSLKERIAQLREKRFASKRKKQERQKAQQELFDAISNKWGDE